MLKLTYNRLPETNPGKAFDHKFRVCKRSIKLTPDFTAKRGNKKFYFELVVKEQSEDDQDLLISKWKALELFANMKGGSLQLFVQNGSLKYANSLIKDNGITAKIIKLNSI